MPNQDAHALRCFHCKLSSAPAPKRFYLPPYVISWLLVQALFQNILTTHWVSIMIILNTVQIMDQLIFLKTDP